MGLGQAIWSVWLAKNPTHEMMVTVASQLTRLQSPTVVYPAREAVNEKIKTIIESGQYDSLVDHYTQYTKSRYIAHVLLTAAMQEGVPVNLFFANTGEENWGFNPAAVGPENSNGTVDVGLTQLNSKTYKGHSMEDLLRPEYNAGLSAVHLLELYKRGMPWEEVVLRYNIGEATVLPVASALRLVRLFAREREYDQNFWSRW